MTAPTVARRGGHGPDESAPLPSPPIGAADEETPTDAPAAPEPAGGVGLGTVLGALAGLWGLMIGLSALSDNSFLTHLATGRLILDGGSVPTADPYSFTAGGDPWTVQSWFASVLYAGAEEIGGLGGVRLLNGLLCTLLGVAVWLLTARSRSFLVRLAATAAVLVPATALWTGRPLLFGLLGLAAVLLVADEQLDPRWLVPIGWVWVNTHGSFPLGVVLLVLLAIGRRLDEGRWDVERRAGLWLLGGFLLAAVNPIGPRLLLFPALLLRRSEAFQAIAEWQAPRYQMLVEWWVLGLVLVAVIGVVRRPSWRATLPLVGFAALAITSARNAAPLCLVVAPILAGAVPTYGIEVGAIRRRSLRLATAGVVLVGVLFAAVSLRGPDSALDAYPTETLAWMEERGMWAPGERVVAPDFVGNFREASAGADANVFIDDRVDMYPLEVVEDYQVLLKADPEWPEVLDRRGATSILWKADTPLGGALLASDDWEVVHRDAPWVVLEPVTAP
ncbi:hypothetical protein PO878_10055 [Iamia majanohamensis]|uniref:Uncharacterized protein n=1 Tax=Iamia majanohamensis TaxID=467976 RepID=A0AAF0BXL1_9ACTN|nr:hypothetical protein [Iamia majanohamensis]WCO69068.1 hypothetical protein PO878_10055 [Iamia majanohamensis]